MSGFATLNTNLFLGSMPTIPVGTGPFLSIAETGGSGPDYVQNQAAPAYVYPSAQFVARSKSYPVARAMAQSAYDAVAGIHNQTVNGTWYMFIKPAQQIFDLGLDEDERARVAFNIFCCKRP